MNVSRRLFLQGAGSGLALASARSARAAGGLLERTVPGTATPFKVLEIHFAGALNHRETFWVERPDEAPVARAIGALNPPTDAILAPLGASADWTSWLPAMGAYTGASYRVGFSGSDAIHLGPCGEPLVRPLTGGGTLISRLRVVATGHISPVHDISQRWMLQGQPENATRASGLAAPITRHSSLPSFVFFDSGESLSQTAASNAIETGFHGSENAPILIPYDNPEIVGLLSGARNPQRDALSQLYNDRYAAGLTFNHPSAAGLRARSVSLDRYLSAIGGAFQGPTLAAALGELSASTGDVVWDNGTRRAIRASAALLSADLSRYCCVCDAGVVGPEGVGSHYDTHSAFVASNAEHAAFNTGNVLNVLRTLREEVDAGNLDLSATLVVLSTEFGREFTQTDGSEHCYRGFAVALLGGPVPLGGGGVVGELPFTSADDAQARESSQPAIATGGLLSGLPVSPTDLRASVLLAAGIHPFQTDVYLQSETNTPSAAPDDAADQLAAHVFGV